MDFTTTGMPGGSPTGLPQDYQDQIDAAQRKQALAQMLTSRAMNFQGPQQTGPVASRTSMFSALANAGMGALGGYQQHQAAEDLSNVRKNYQTDQTADVAKLQQLPADQQVNYGQTSKFPMTQALAKAMADKREKENAAIGGFYSANGDVPNAVASVRGQATTGPKAQLQPSYERIPDPNNPSKTILAVKEYDKNGVPSIKFAPAGTNVTTNVDNKIVEDQSKEINATIGKTLGEKRTIAEGARNAYGAASQAISALESGATAGGGEDVKQTVRKAAQAMGVDLPETASTEELKMALGKAALEGAKALRPTSDTDLKILAQTLGSINTDPTALTRVLAHTQAIALRDLQSYHDYVGENQKTVDPKLQDLFRGATTGFDMPTQLSGPVSYQMEVAKKLQQQGYDISRLIGPDGKPFDKNAKFNIDPTQGFPGIQNQTNPGITPPTAGTAANPLRVDQLTPAQKAQLLKKLQGR